jgi:hypothetical protein
MKGREFFNSSHKAVLYVLIIVIVESFSERPRVYLNERCLHCFREYSFLYLASVNMALVLDRAAADDAPAIARIWALGFNDPFNSLRYGSMTLDDKTTLFTRHILKYLEDKEAQWFVMRDNDASGKVAAFAAWRPPKNKQEGNGDQEGEINDEQQLQEQKSMEERLRDDFSPFTEKVNIPLIAESLEMWARLKRRTLRGRPAFG